MNDIDTLLNALETVVRERQKQRGYTEFFSVGDLVRFPLGAPWNVDSDYEIVLIYRDGLVVRTIDQYRFEYTLRDELAIALGMKLSPAAVQS